VNVRLINPLTGHRVLSVVPRVRCEFELRAGWPKEPCTFPQLESVAVIQAGTTQWSPISVFPWNPEEKAIQERATTNALPSHVRAEKSRAQR
jgi:hypothetical protein